MHTRLQCTSTNIFHFILTKPPKKRVTDLHPFLEDEASPGKLAHSPSANRWDLVCSLNQAELYVDFTMTLQNPLFCYFGLDRNISINWQRVKMFHIKVILSTWDSYFETIWKVLSTFPEATVAGNSGQVCDRPHAVVAKRTQWLID